MSNDNLSQFDLRFQDLLRHPDWRVEPCQVWIGSSGEWYSGETHQRVIHRADPALYVIPRLFNSIVSPKMRSFSSYTERRQLVKFAREVVRFDGLMASVRVREGATSESDCNKPAHKVYRDGVVTRIKPSDDRKPAPNPPVNLTRAGLETEPYQFHFDPDRGPHGVIAFSLGSDRYVVSVLELEQFRIKL